MPLNSNLSLRRDTMRMTMAGMLMACLLSACGGGDSGAFISAPPLTQEVVGPDPLLSKQWHLFNNGQSGGVPGMDLGLGGVKETGRGVLMAFVDGAVQIRHPDLVANLHTVGGYLPTADPSPETAPPDAPYKDTAGAWDDAHGTAVVGIALARANNSMGGRGVAPEARFMAFNGLSNGRVGDALRAAVEQGADIVNNSWGFLDPQKSGGQLYQSADSVWREALDRAVTQGRQGRGTVVVFAAGNGGGGDDSNRDGYANHPGVLAVGSVDHQGRPPAYAEPGSNVLVSAPSVALAQSYFGESAIWTTDLAGPRGLSGGTESEKADYAAFSGGTSASAPMVSGVVALMLQANPSLTWRDVRWLLARTARPASLGPLETAASAMNSHGFHPLVGFGRVHAADAVDVARVFRGLPVERQCNSGWLSAPQAIADAPDPGLILEHRFQSCDLSVVESVQLTVKIEHAYGADLQMVLTSPAQRQSLLARPHLCNVDFKGVCGDFSQGWTFHSVRHMGEEASGIWQLHIQDLQAEDSGRLVQWRLLVTGH